MEFKASAARKDKCTTPSSLLRARRNSSVVVSLLFSFPDARAGLLLQQAQHQQGFQDVHVPPLKQTSRSLLLVPPAAGAGRTGGHRMRKQRQPSSCLFSRRSASVGWAGPPDKQQRLAFLPEDSENKEGNYFAGMFSGMSARGSINNSINNGRNAGSVNGDNGDSFESPSCEGSSGGGGGGGNGGDGGDGDGIGGSNRDGMVKEEEDIPTEVPGRTPKAVGAAVVPPTCAMNNSPVDGPVDIPINTSTHGLETEVATFKFAPAMTVHKFKTLQDRRVPVGIKYSGGGGFKRYFEEIASVLKKRFPDLLIQREIVEVSSSREGNMFEIRIDGKLVCSKRRGRPGVYLQMEAFEQAIRKARQRRRPGSIVYGDKETYRNVKALTDQRTPNSFSLEQDGSNLTTTGKILTDGQV